MPEFLINADPTLLVIILIGGLGYWLASGAVRTSDYKALPVILGTALFSIIGLLVHYVVKQGLDNFIISIFTWHLPSLFVVMLSAYFWRKWLSERIFVCLRKMGITTIPFGPSGAWDTLENGNVLYYFKIYLTDGSALGSDQAVVKKACLSVNPDTTIDAQGNISFIATEIWEKECKESQKPPIKSSDGHTIFTYIPATNINRIEAHFHPSTKN